MSTGTFVNALIGLAREFKMMERRAEGFNRSAEAKGIVSRRGPPAFGREVAIMMQEKGYFPKAESDVFGDALEILLQASDPRYRK